MDQTQILSSLAIFLIPLVLGYVCGTIAERRHYASIVQREHEQRRFPLVSAEASFTEERVKRAFMVQGSVVISIDYFKRVLAGLRQIFGGRIAAYESLVDRARREAILRMKEMALEQGADVVVNLRLETATIGTTTNRRGGIGSVEVIAYGTAVVMNTK